MWDTLPTMMLSLLIGCGPKVDPSTSSPSRVLIDTAEVDASWDDGDTFSWIDATSGERVRARLKGYNTLESYGPVHRWGTWSATELHDLASAATVRARSAVWACTTTGESGGYGRVSMDCPELRKALLAEGLAHVFAIDTPPDPADLKIQARAMRTEQGMWAKGAPQGLITSLHSAAERDDGVAYNRICSLLTGMCPKIEHSEVYATCQEVCAQGSCMLYVPYKQRYGDDKADCLAE